MLVVDEGWSWQEESASSKPSDGKSGVWIDDDAWVEADIAPRPWIAPGYLLRGSVSLLAGMGAAGKSMLAIGWAIAAAKKLDWGGFRPTQECRVALYNVEDDRDEQRRRVSAALRQHGLRSPDIAGRVARIGPEGVGTLLDFDIGSGQVVATPAMVALAEWIAVARPDVLIVDPLAELHTAPENDNNALRTVIAFFRRLAQQYEMAVLIIAHTRKGPASPGDADTIRGASSIVGAVRVALTVVGMSPEEAAELGLSDIQRRLYFRVDGAKSNYAAAREAEWFERVDYALDNGESIAAAVPWSPPSSGAAGSDVLAIVARDIGQGMGAARIPWSPKLSGEARSIRALLERHGVCGAAAQRATLETLIADYGIEVGTFRDHHENRAKGLRIGDNSPPARWVGRA